MTLRFVPPPATVYPAAGVVLLLLMAVDVLLIGVHIVKPYVGLLRPHYFSLEADRGLAELFQYLKEASVATCLAGCWRRTALRPYLLWAGVFVLLLADDALGLHERFGLLLADAGTLSPMLGIRAQDVGELLYAALFGVLSLFLLVPAMRDRGNEPALRPSMILLALLMLLGLFGVLIDAVHVVAYYQHSRLSWILAIAEDGGELLVMSALVAYAYRLYSRAGNPG